MMGRGVCIPGETGASSVKWRYPNVLIPLYHRVVSRALLYKTRPWYVARPKLIFSPLNLPRRRRI